MRVEVDHETGFVPPADKIEAILEGKAATEPDTVVVGSQKQTPHPHIEMQVIQEPQPVTPVVAQSPLPEPIPVPMPVDVAANEIEVAKDKTPTEGTTTTEEKPSAWRRFVEGIKHDPLNDPEFVEAYHVWRKQNRKERYERRRAWIVAHGCKAGCLVGLVKKDRKEEAWQAYKEKLAYMED